MTRTEISNLFHHNLKDEQIVRMLQTLVGEGLAVPKKERTSGRSVERWFALW
jgi:hypothetical protein